MQTGYLLVVEERRPCYYCLLVDQLGWESDRSVCSLLLQLLQ